ncbi:serine/threonine-protein kinase Nek11 [Engraulis encrasicolus]|uniref:serine/threonine-protein kinase Nek11 n=1 Tax=Engraulis encrasicolus TaxID=184585 RepID=UPI002FCF7869
MPKFKERTTSAHALPSESNLDHAELIAKRYAIRRRLGRGSFGTIYLVHDIKAADGDTFKVLKEIAIGGLKPDETVQANQEAQLLSQLHHPAILKFYTSFLERDSFCIITEYCEDRDLHCKLEELRASGSWLSQAQVTEWLIQLLLGVHYMHQRRILHRDLKAKNIFLKKNIVKIGDFGVSCLLMGSCDLATTFTGTPYYMSPEALSHRGYDAKSDIWSLGCVLYEMCCLAHAFEGPNFLSVVMTIVEGETPTLPERYSTELNTLMQRMLMKDPLSRISATDALKTKYIEENMQVMKHRLSNMTLRDRTAGGERRDAAQILRAMQKKVHLQTLQQRAEVQRMTPRERMRLRKLQAADEKASKLKKLAEEKYQENCIRMKELRWRHFQTVTVDVLTEAGDDGVVSPSHSTPPLDRRSPGPVDTHSPGPVDRRSPSPVDSHLPGPVVPAGEDGSAQLGHPAKADVGIPDDPVTAEAYYNEDGFESCSEEEEDEDEEEDEEEDDQVKDEDMHVHYGDDVVETEAFDTFQHTYGQDVDLEAMVWHMENILDTQPSGRYQSWRGGNPGSSEGVCLLYLFQELERGRSMQLQEMERSKLERGEIHVSPGGDPGCSWRGRSRRERSTFRAVLRVSAVCVSGAGEGAIHAATGEGVTQTREGEFPGKGEIQASPRGATRINTIMARSRIHRMRESVCQRLGQEAFERVYEYLREARRRREGEAEVREALSGMVERPADCFEVDQLLYYEEQLQEVEQRT